LFDKSTNSAAPDGPGIELHAGTHRVVIDPVRGGRLASWTVDGEELLLGPPDDADSSIRWGCFLMAPWPGRLADARFEWHDRAIRLRRTHGRHAIHGLTWNRPWAVEATSSSTATLALDLPRDEWPMGGRVRQRIELTREGLRLEAQIDADEPMPAAIGWHPWFRRRSDARLRIDADDYQVTRAMVPTGDTAPVRGRTDLRAGPLLGRRRVDLCYLGARSPAVVTWPDLELTIAFDPSPAPLVVYTPPHSFCIEPLTAPPNAFSLPGATARAVGVRELRGGERFSASMTMRLSGS
jgi:aldose 1-epimerase